MKQIEQYINLFLNKKVPISLIEDFINDENHEPLCAFINYNLKKELYWMTGIGIMDSAELNYKLSIENGNIME